MITLPNGDKWIIDESEISELDYAEAKKGNVPATSIDDFLRQLLASDNFVLPRKLTTEFDGYWDCNFDPIDEVLGALAVTKLETPMFNAYQMVTGEIHVIYMEVDSGGYDACTEVKTFLNREEYMKAVTFPN